MPNSPDFPQEDPESPLNGGREHLHYATWEPQDLADRRAWNAEAQREFRQDTLLEARLA